jgi:2-C-methyl-D-erythritol 4-phosphate cytidylyltransferase
LKKSAIIVAGGLGTRFNAGLPKQFLLLAGIPVLAYSIEAFRSAFRDISIVVVLPQTHISRWEEMCRDYSLEGTHRIAAGGSTRFQSVKNGLAMIEPVGLTAIHDAARPLVSPGLILQTFDIAVRYGSAVPVIPVTESVRSVEGDQHKPVDRSRLRLVQTPQVFMASFLRKAYEQPYNEAFTDDAMVAGSAGATVRLTEGDPVNIKITTPGDLTIAEALLAARSS